jgi:acyl-coenzyme A thioesterase PaaI-like protein
MITPQNTDCERVVRDSFAAQPLMATIGARLSRVTAGIVDIRLPFRSDLTQQHGFLHAGVVASALDRACG